MSKHSGIRRALTGFGLACLFATTAHAQNFPAKPVHLVVPFAPGGGTDTVARGLADGLRQIWNQPVIVENKPGGGQFVGSEYVARAAPDGYTILVANDAGLEYNLALYSKMPYDPRKDYALVTRLVQINELVLVNSGVPVNSAREFIEYARKNPDKLNYGSPTVGSPEQIGMEAFATAAGFKITHVAYKGTAPALLGVVAGDVQAIVTSTLIADQYIKSGKLKPLVVSGKTRSRLVPDTPTFAEIGYPDLMLGYYLAFVAPAGTPQPLLDKIAADTRTVLNSPAFRAKFVDPFEYEIMAETPAEFAAYYKAHLPIAMKRAQDSGAKLD